MSTRNEPISLGVLSYIYNAAINADNKHLVFYRKKRSGRDTIIEEIDTGVALNVLKEFSMDNDTGILTFSTTLDPEPKSYLIKEQNQGSRIAAELYINRLKAVKVLQDKYYKNEYKLSSNTERNDTIIRVLEKDNPS